MTKHLAVDVSGNLHDGLVAGAAFGKFRNEGVPVVVPAARHLRILARGLPRRLERGNVPRGIGRHRPAPGEDVPLLPDFTESLAIPCAVFYERLIDFDVQRNDPSFSGFALGPSYLDRPVVEVDLASGKGLDLGVPETSVAGQHECRVHMRTA